METSGYVRATPEGIWTGNEPMCELDAAEAWNARAAVRAVVVVRKDARVVVSMVVGERASERARR
jgi:hypothetical protein